ncbi:hypothetical protein SS50377_26648 [Spironucleus salmonicida]|uniref:Uncharacterized protein n=1 Tax=Spironucleus salmonicida TaxID=348837 RepID=V6LB71_9EUKA|nr:hypothetical protein SS50377_26627 [Spironucleus salmonicida]KAH0572438.1 hypothetical protein SS50377_26648 [Spironucleus salmonicida]|eukprot:EST41474.1 Hypothetical protein SS50377_19200 [Spironucleus salmonicida]
MDLIAELQTLQVQCASGLLDISKKLQLSNTAQQSVLGASLSNTLGQLALFQDIPEVVMDIDEVDLTKSEFNQ